MTQIFGSSLACPWALVVWGASSPGRRPATAVAYLTDKVGDDFEGGLVEFYRLRAALKAVRDPTSGKIIRYDTAVPGDTFPRWHFRFKRPRRFAAVAVFFPNGKGRDQGPTPAQVKQARRLVPKTPAQ